MHYGTDKYIVNCDGIFASDPHAPPQNVQTLATTSTTATISWLPPPDEHQNGRIVYYILIITDLGFGTNDVVLNSTVKTAMATNLQEFNNYSCIVAAATKVGLGPYSLPIMFTTLQDGILSVFIVPLVTPLHNKGLVCNH